MQASVSKRESLLLKFTTEDSSDFSRALKDTVFEELFDFGKAVCAPKEAISLMGAKSDESVAWSENGILVPSFIELIQERNKDVEPNPQPPQKPEQAQVSPIIQGKKEEKRGGSAKQDNKKKKGEVKFELNEQGLYAPLPDFDKDIDMG